MESNNLFARETPVTLEQVLTSKEERAVLQHTLLKHYGRPLVSFTLNLPGAYKAYPLALKAFSEGSNQIAAALKERSWVTAYQTARSSAAGFEGFYAVDAEARELKAAMIAIEDTHPLGRLFDIDVLCLDSMPLKGTLQGRPERECLICGKPVWACARNRAHSAEDLAFRAYFLLREFFLGQFADQIAADAQTALSYEVAVTPKPGLVDQANNGAHSDMNLFTFLRSSCVLGSYFRDCVKAGADHKDQLETLLPAVRHLGIRAERNMLRATNGVNTHKGAIFSLGIVCLALGWLWGRDRPITPKLCLNACGLIASVCVAELESGFDTHGLNCYRRYGLQGTRGEAANGFPHVQHHGLPALTEALAAGASFNDAGVAAFLHLLATVPDTCAIHRANPERLTEIQLRIQKFLAERPDIKMIILYADALDRRMIHDNISPGGCADLLAVSYFLYLVTGGDTCSGEGRIRHPMLRNGKDDSP